MSSARQLTRAEHLSRWSELHGEYDVASGSRLLRGWLGLVYTLARPLAAAGVSAHLLSLLAVGSAGGAVAVVRASPLSAAVLVLASALLDGLDGAVAVLRRTESFIGALLDSIGDRAADVLFLVALWRVGGSGLWCLLAGGALVLLEYTRARAGSLGVREIAVVTVGERPSRVALAALGLGLQPVIPSAPTLGAAGTATLCAVALLQLLVAFGKLRP
jgi:CDP-diacylglycerol--glycerol-3-phosphate 3-phosphatidyltransferase